MIKTRTILSLMAFSVITPAPVWAQEPAEEEELVVDREADSYAIAEHLYSQARQAGLDADSRRLGMARAALLFENFVKEFPQSSRAIRAQYLQATCLEATGDNAAAAAVLQKIADNPNGGEYTASAAYRLASQAASRNLWDRAEKYFRITIATTGQAELKFDAEFRLGRVLMQKGEKQEAETLFRGLASGQGVPAVLVNVSLYTLGQMKTEACEFAEAYDFFSRLLERADVEESMRSVATLQAARLASKLNRPAEANAHYARLSSMAGMEAYHGEAQMDSLLSLYRQKSYQAVVDLVRSQYVELNDPEREARRAIIVGQSYMELRDFNSAAQWYQVAEKALPNSALAADAAYRRLICAQQTRSGNFISLAQAFLRTYAAAGQSTATLPCVDLVRLMYADRLMLADVQEASRQFEAINFANLSNLSAQVRADAMYKKAWCAYHGGTADAISTLNEFIRTFTTDVRLPEALALRGCCYVNQNNLDAALADFDRVINEYPQSPAVPMCLQRAAQACASRDKNRMVNYYERLIQCAGRAKPSAIAEAHYLIARVQMDENPSAAIPHFREARTLNPEQYGSAVDLCLVHCFFKMQDADNLREALVTLERNNPASYQALPPAIPRWCGWMCFQSHRYLDADKYLSEAVARAPKIAYDAPDGTRQERADVEALVWKSLARARLELRQFERGLEAAQHYVSMETQPYRKAEGMRDMAQLLIGLNRTAEARALCEEAIALGIDGPIKSSVFITLGDSYFAERAFTDAARYYGRTANVVGDRELKPVALYKVAIALRLSDRSGEAEQYEQALHNEFPNWLPEANVSIFMKMHDNQ